MFLLALILEDQGDTTSAIKQLDEFLKVSPRGENARQAREALKRLKS
jgi:cytochrome c-type biogenesis protein CcmH/NrfG